MAQLSRQPDRRSSLAGICTLFIERRLYERRRQRHLGDGTRAAAGLPSDRARSMSQLMIRQLAILLGAFALGTAIARRARRGQPRGRPRRRPGLLRGGAGLAPAALSARRASSSARREVERRRHLEVLGRGRDGSGPCPPPPRPASPRRSRPRRAPGRPSSAARSASTRKTCGVCAAQSSSRSSVSSTTNAPLPSYGRGESLRPAGARLIVSVTGAAAITPAASGSAARVATTPSTSSGVSSGRAASWIATSSVSTAARALATDSARVAPPSTTTSSLDPAELVTWPGGHGDDDRAHRHGRRAGLDRPLDHRPAGERHEGLRAAGSEPLPGAGGRDDCGDGCRGC